MESFPYKLIMTHAVDRIEMCSIFHCRDDTDALIKALEIISRRCKQEIYGEHTLLDSKDNVVDIDSFLDEFGCPLARYDPTRRDDA